MGGIVENPPRRVGVDGMPKRERLTRLVRPLRRGQITIPAEFRRRLGITEESLLQLTLEDHELRIRAVRPEAARGSPWLKELEALFAPVQAEASQYSDEEINATIDAAIAAVRENYAARGL